MAGDDDFEDEPDGPVRPSDLAGEAGDLWATLAEALVDRLEPEDGPVLELFCRSVVILRNALKALQTEGLTVKLNNGMHSAHPAVKVVAELRKTVSELATKLGLSPRDRRALFVTPAQPADAEEERQFARILGD